MTGPSGGKRVDSASKVVGATPPAVYAAFVDPDSLASWLPPQGMTGRVLAFDLREGGGYRMVLSYDQPDHAAPGKTSAHADVVEARFVKLVPGERIVQAVEFDSDDAAFAGIMTMTWSLTPVHDGTEVTITCEDVPEGIRPEDHATGLGSTLDNLAAFIEGRRG